MRDRWPAGAWFGCQVGGTAWLLTGAAGMARSAPGVAAAWAGLCVAANALGAWLWVRHRRGRPGAERLMLLACAAAGSAALVMADAVRPAPLAAGVPAAAYVPVVVVPAILIVLVTVRSGLRPLRTASPATRRE